MGNIVSLIVKKSIEREVKKMKKLIVIAAALLFTLATAMPANAAFSSDVAQILYAEADLETGIADLKVMPIPHLEDRDTGAEGGAVSSGNPIAWEYDTSATWKVADQYLRLSYQANLAGWGIQLYSDNTSGSASPQWAELPLDPDNLIPDSPGGLVGEGSVKYISIPVAWKVLPGGDYDTPEYSDGTGFDADTEYKTYYTEPSESYNNGPDATVGTDDDYIELYQYKNGSALYGKYCWLMDKGTTKWVDANSNDTVDPNEADVSVYSDGLDINTVVNYLGSSTCTYDSTGTFIYRDACASPIYIILAAKIAVGTIKAKYSTNTLTLELYHE